VVIFYHGWKTKKCTLRQPSIRCQWTFVLSYFINKVVAPNNSWCAHYSFSFACLYKHVSSLAPSHTLLSTFAYVLSVVRIWGSHTSPNICILVCPRCSSYLRKL
jgi:hypothetical protein